MKIKKKNEINNRKKNWNIVDYNKKIAVFAKFIFTSVKLRKNGL